MSDLSQSATTTDRSPKELILLAEQVARILGLQKLEDVSAAEFGIFGRSTMSKVCSAASRGCEIHTSALAA